MNTWDKIFAGFGLLVALGLPFGTLMVASRRDAKVPNAVLANGHDATVHWASLFLHDDAGQVKEITPNEAQSPPESPAVGPAASPAAIGALNPHHTKASFLAQHSMAAPPLKPGHCQWIAEGPEDQNPFYKRGFVFAVNEGKVVEISDVDETLCNDADCLMWNAAKVWGAQSVDVFKGLIVRSIVYMPQEGRTHTILNNPEAIKAKLEGESGGVAPWEWYDILPKNSQLKLEEASTVESMPGASTSSTLASFVIAGQTVKVPSNSVFIKFCGAGGQGEQGESSPDPPADAESSTTLTSYRPRWLAPVGGMKKSDKTKLLDPRMKRERADKKKGVEGNAPES